MRLNPTPLSAALVVAGSCTWFVISTITMDQMPDAAMMSAALLGALAFVSAFAGTPSGDAVKAAPRRELWMAAAVGVLTWFAPAWIVLTQRATDAPSGTEMLFFTTAAWAMIAALLALGLRDERPLPTQVAAVALSLLGAATVLANWERPSSFSPFVKFPAQEGIILAAGLLFAVGLLMGKRSGRILGTRTSLWIGVAAAALVATLIAVPSGFASPDTLLRIWPQLLIAGASLATLATGMTALVRTLGLVRATSWLLVAPVAVTLLSVVERLTIVYGPNPLIVTGVAGGAILAIAGLLIVQLYPGPVAASSALQSTLRDPWSSRLVLASRAVAAVAVSGGLVGLLLPAFSATSVGTTDSGEAFSVTWSLLGAESAVGWLALTGAVLALALAFDVSSSGTFRRLLAAATLAAASFAAYPLVVATPLRTWNRWIPAEIQQAYGTEYARLSIDATPGVIHLASAAFALAACLILVVLAARGIRDPEPVHTVLEENE